MAIGDVDNDKCNELVVGTINGDMFIYQGSKDSQPLWKASDLGMITCLEIGNVCNHSMNYVVALNGEGWCYIFAVKPQSLAQSSEATSEDSQSHTLRFVHQQHLTANNKVVIIADIDGDGKCEMVVGYTDRQVKSYRWTENEEATEGGATSTLNGTFVVVETWQLAGQLGSMTTNQRTDGTVDLMVSQPGGTFVSLFQRNSSMGGENDTSKPDTKSPSLIYHPLGSGRARNPGVTTEVVGGISRQRKGEPCSISRYSAICTLDGTLTLVDDDKILWSLYVDHQLFTLTRLDVTGDGMEEVVACSWDGQTYLVNLNRDAVRFPFEENVAAFCAGHYAVGGENVPCLIYATFSNRIVVYHGIHLSQIGTTNLIKTMDEHEEVRELLAYFNCDASKPSHVRKLYHWCLYGRHPTNSQTMLTGPTTTAEDEDNSG
ncbi:KICSTOR complex protein ITFG2 [Lamellibrachia satsuma]|nr:KICSTOR complex protein ITFG2 [Lamellibrachia satsuma]